MLESWEKKCQWFLQDNKQAKQTTWFIARPTVTEPRLTEARKALLGHLRLWEDEGLSAEICFALCSLSLRALPRDCVLIVWNFCHITLEVLLRTLTEFIFSLPITALALITSLQISSNMKKLSSPQPTQTVPVDAGVLRPSSNSGKITCVTVLC